MNPVKHEKAIRKLKKCKKNELIETTVEDNCCSTNVVPLKDIMSTPTATLKSVGYYQHHDKDYIFLSQDSIDEEDDRSNWNIQLTKYLLEVSKLKKVKPNEK